MGNGAGDATADRKLAPAITGRENSESDPPIMEQLTNEIGQATSFIQTQACRVRNHTDRMFGSEVQEEKGEDREKIAEVRPQMEVLGEAICNLHNATSELSRQCDRLEAHRLV